MRPTFPAPLARGPLRFSLTGDLNGIALRDEDTGEAIAVFPTLAAAADARNAARDALAQLATCLASAPSRRGAL